MSADWQSTEAIITELLDHPDAQPVKPQKEVSASGYQSLLFEIPRVVGSGHVELFVFEDGLKMLVVNGTWKETRHLTIVDENRIRLNLHLNLAHTLIPEREEDIDTSAAWRITHPTSERASEEKIEARQPKKWVELVFPRSYLDAFLIDHKFSKESISSLHQNAHRIRSFPFDYQLNTLTSQILSLSAHDAIYLRLAHIKSMEVICLALERMISADLQEQREAQQLRPKDAKAISLAREIIVNSLPRIPTVSELCQSVGINRNKLTDGFKQFLGLSPAQFIEEHRLASAHELLRDPSKRLYEIAFEVGYGNPGTFSTAFKRHFGLTPRAAREALRSIHESRQND